jgi:hypothetical protein
MERRDNYQLQVAQAKRRFLTYDQETLIRKCSLQADEQYIYVNLLCKLYRIHRTTGDFSRQQGTQWVDGNSHGEVLTILDLICDSKEDRHLSGRWQSMESFGHTFHRSLLDKKDPVACRIDADPEGFRRACRALNAIALDGGDIGYAVELFENLRIGLLFWHGDEEFYPRLRYVWDANAGMYLRYETMFYALGLLNRILTEEMENPRGM